MSDQKKYQNKINILGNDEIGDAGGSQGGRSGQVEFVDFMSSNTKEEIKRVQSMHTGIHEAIVKKQKASIEALQAVKEGKVPVQAYHQGLGAGMGAGASKAGHPLSKAAQFSGDAKTNPVPSEYVGVTNEGEQQEADNKFELRYAPQNAPRNTIKLRPPGA